MFHAADGSPLRARSSSTASHSVFARSCLPGIDAGTRIDVTTRYVRCVSIASSWSASVPRASAASASTAAPRRCDVAPCATASALPSGGPWRSHRARYCRTTGSTDSAARRCRRASAGLSWSFARSRWNAGSAAVSGCASRRRSSASSVSHDAPAAAACSRASGARCHACACRSSRAGCAIVLTAERSVRRSGSAWAASDAYSRTTGARCRSTAAWKAGSPPRTSIAARMIRASASTKRCCNAAPGARPSASSRRASSITVATTTAGFVASSSDDAGTSGGNR